MPIFIVKEVIDGDTFIVKGSWKWGRKTGKVIRPLGYNTPEKGKYGYKAAKEKLKKLIEGKKVVVKDAVKISYGRLLCRVSYRGRNLSSYFSKYR